MDDVKQKKIEKGCAISVGILSRTTVDRRATWLYSLRGDEKRGNNRAEVSSSAALSKKIQIDRLALRALVRGITSTRESA